MQEVCSSDHLLNCQAKQRGMFSVDTLSLLQYFTQMLNEGEKMPSSRSSKYFRNRKSENRKRLSERQPEWKIN